MAAITLYQCEICGIESANPSHWFIIQCSHEELKVLKWNTEAAAGKGARHYCGEAHASVYISRWLEASCSPPKPDFNQVSFRRAPGARGELTSSPELPSTGS